MIASDGRHDRAAGALAALVATLPADDPLRDGLPVLLARARGNLSRGRRDPDEVQAAVERLWGDQAFDRVGTAEDELQRLLTRLTPAAREAVDTLLDESGLREDVALLLLLVDRATWLQERRQRALDAQPLVKQEVQRRLAERRAQRGART